MTGKQSAGAAQSSGGNSCPSCGAPVVPGDPRCGTCRALLPAAMRGVATRQASTNSFRASMYSGGTTVATGMDPRQRRMVGIGVGIGAVLALVGFLVLGGDGDQAATEAGAGADPDGELGQPGQAQAGGAEAAGPGSELTGQLQQQASTPAAAAAEAARERAANMGEAARELGLLLRNERLWSSVMIDRAEPNVLIIRSSLCDDPGMQAAVDRALGDLRQNGVAAVRCLAPHGGVAFEKTL